MKEIKFKSNFGPFAYEITTEVGEDVNEASTNLCIAGIANTAYRAVGSAVEKALVKAGVMAEKTPRNEIAYSGETATLVVEAAQEKLDAIVKADKLPTLLYAPQGEHQYGEGQGSTRKLAEAMVETATKDGSLAALRLMLGIAADAEVVTGALVEKVHEKFFKRERKAKA